MRDGGVGVGFRPLSEFYLLACKKLKVSREGHHMTNELHIRACLGVSQDTGSEEK